jgi:hypothetical protein
MSLSGVFVSNLSRKSDLGELVGLGTLFEGFAAEWSSLMRFGK